MMSNPKTVALIQVKYMVSHRRRPFGGDVLKLKWFEIKDFLGNPVLRRTNATISKRGDCLLFQLDDLVGGGEEELLVSHLFPN